MKPLGKTIQTFLPSGVTGVTSGDTQGIRVAEIAPRIL